MREATRKAGRLLAVLAVAAMAAGIAIGQTVVVVNYGTRSFTGWVLGTTASRMEESSRTSSGYELRTGREVCPGVHTLWVRRAAGIPVGVTTVDASNAMKQDAPATPMPSIERIVEVCGLPTVDGVPLQLVSAVADGPGVHAAFRARRGIWVYDLDLPFVWGQGWSRFCLEVTCSDVTQDVNAADAPATQLRFTVPQSFDRGHVLFWTPPPALRFAADQAQRYRGVVFWPEMPGDKDARADAVQMVWTPLHLWDRAHEASLPPFRAMDELPSGFRARDLWLRAAPAARSLPGTWAQGPFGAPLFGSITGGNDGYTQNGESLRAADGPWTLDLLVECALALGRRPENFREHDGRPLDLARHQTLRTWGGWPHPAYTDDMLGKTSRLPSWETPGSASPPDQQHFLAAMTAFAARASGEPALQRSVHALIVNLVTMARRDTSARAIGWTSHATAVLHESCGDADMRTRLRTWAEQQRAGLVRDCGRPVGHPGWWHSVTNASRFGGRPYVPGWEHAIAVLGLAGSYEVFRDVRDRDLCVQAALLVQRHFWTTSTPPVAIQARVIEADGVSLGEGIEDDLYHQWLATASCALLRYGRDYPQVTAADMARATQIKEQERQAALRAGQPAEWIF